MPDAAELVQKIALVGRSSPSRPPLGDVEPLAPFVLSDGRPDQACLDRRDGSLTRRELFARFLLLCAVLDQGPDIEGVRKLLVEVTNSLYAREVRFLHSPISFFRELGLAIDKIVETHGTVKEIRAHIWAKENQSSAERYNLFMDNSTQALNYAVFRWGVPLGLFLVLASDCPSDDGACTALLDYLQRWRSAEEMSNQIKDHPRYGLGKAIGDKACHLYAKWFVAVFGLARSDSHSWGPLSFEAPFDSNAGRVLWRTGYLLLWAQPEEYIANQVIQVGQGKQGLNYIRVTNIRGMGASVSLPADVGSAYSEVAVHHLRTHSRPPRKVEIQRIQHAYLLSRFAQDGLGVADFDDGLIHIGTTYCFNHGQPLCSDCPLSELCQGHLENPALISEYRT